MMRFVVSRMLKFFRFLFLESPFAAIVISLAAFYYLTTYVDLQPHVEPDFFFSSDDPQLKEEKKFSTDFPQQTQLIVSAAGDLSSEVYLERLNDLTQELMLVDEVTSVKSIANGPGDFERAIESPLWRRLLISEDVESSNLIIFLPRVAPKIVIPKIEQVLKDYSEEGFDLKIAGVPYAVELIRRYLLRDLKIFSGIAFIMFSFVVIIIFRSFRVLLGTLITCLDACVFTLIFSQVFDVKIGVLTANISTIVFVLTLSHIVFLTNNWMRLKGDEYQDNILAAREAVKLTFGASFWCMLTTLLGFASLMNVDAKPLRELGFSGVLGTLLSIIAAYGIYPLFLMAGRSIVKKTDDQQKKNNIFVGHYMWATVIFALLTGFAIAGLSKMNTDPSLLSYFKAGDSLRDGMEYIDRNGGSSPLNIVVRDRDNKLLNTSEAYDKLWKLQESLEQDPGVGSVISLPVLLAEGKRVPFSFLVTLERMLRIMGDKKYASISKTFVTDDRMRANFFLRMKESSRKRARVEVIERLKNIVIKHGFELHTVSGIYRLQGLMSQEVIGSLIKGLCWLMALFFIIAFMVSWSAKVTIAMVCCLSVIPLCMLGLIGHMNVPLDIISAPAANVAIGMGIDSMIHMVVAMRRYLAQGNGFWQAWKNARHQLWKPIISSMCIVSAGFGIFSFSLFPPSQRFGLAVVVGTFLAAPVALFVLPSVVGPWFYKD